MLESPELEETDTHIVVHIRPTVADLRRIPLKACTNEHTKRHKSACGHRAEVRIRRQRQSPRRDGERGERTTRSWERKRKRRAPPCCITHRILEVLHLDCGEDHERCEDVRYGSARQHVERATYA